MINTQLLSDICKKPGVSGFEKPIRDFIMQEVSPLVDEVRIDAMGNIITLKKGKGNKSVMIAAHLDEIGFCVTAIDDRGFIHFTNLGGFDPKTLTAQRVIIHGKKDIIGVMGSKPIHLMSPEERAAPLKLSDFFIDTGLPADEVKKIVNIGDSVSRERELIEMGECVNSKSLDNRVSVFILLETLRELQGKEVPYDVYGVFTVQEEIGIRGAQVAAHQINPDFGFGLDVTIAFDVPSAKPHEMITELGKGTAIKVMDRSVVCDYRMVKFMKETANKNDIPYQLEVLTGGGTDTAGIQLRGQNGAIAGCVSIPCRHVHQVIEMCHKKDIRDSILLLKHCLLGLDQYDWSH